MREISIEHTDYDLVANELNVFIERGYLLRPNIVLGRDKWGIYFYYLNKEVSEVEEVVNVEKSRIVSFLISDPSLANINYDELANMSFKDLSELL